MEGKEGGKDASFYVPAGATGKPNTAKAAKAPPSCPSTAPARPTPSMAVGEEEEEEAGRCDDGGGGIEDCCWLGGVGVKALAVARKRTSPDRTCLVMLSWAVCCVLCRVV